jgi:hypothetical protein
MWVALSRLFVAEFTNAARAARTATAIGATLLAFAFGIVVAVGVTESVVTAREVAIAAGGTVAVAAVRTALFGGTARGCALWLAVLFAHVVYARKPVLAEAADTTATVRTASLRGAVFECTLRLAATIINNFGRGSFVGLDIFSYVHHLAIGQHQRFLGDVLGCICDQVKDMVGNLWQVGFILYQVGEVLIVGFDLVAGSTLDQGNNERKKNCEAQRPLHGSLQFVDYKGMQS